MCLQTDPGSKEVFSPLLRQGLSLFLSKDPRMKESQREGERKWCAILQDAITWSLAKHLHLLLRATPKKGQTSSSEFTKTTVNSEDVDRDQSRSDPSPASVLSVLSITFTEACLVQNVADLQDQVYSLGEEKLALLKHFFGDTQCYCWWSWVVHPCL